MLTAHGSFYCFKIWKCEYVSDLSAFLRRSFFCVNRKSMSRIFPAKTVLASKPAPRVAAFSSKGPNALTPEILKVQFLLKDQ